MPKDKNRFDYEAHMETNKIMLAEIGAKRAQSNRQAVVALRHPDGRSVTVNADRADSAFQSWTRQGFQVQEHEKHLLETAVSNATPELKVANERAASLEDALRTQNEKHDLEMAELRAKIDALTKATQTGKSVK